MAYNSNIIISFLSFFIFTSTCFSSPITIAASSSSPSSTNEIDLVSLLAIKSRLNDPKGALNSWNQATHYCNWTGIVCGHKHPNRVVAINLRSQGLVGSLSPYIGNLSFLRNIILQNNTFQGQIPQEIGRLRRLERVEFNNNSFSGPIPKNLSRCTNLVYLNLIDNKLSGTIPDELGYSLYKLEVLGLGSNTFSGHIPSFIGNLTSLRRLGLSECVSQGGIPQSFVKLEKLYFLSLMRNNLTGMVPSGLFNISTLVALELGQNQLQGTLPSTLGLTLPNLEVLSLFTNQFSGPLPESFDKLEKLSILSLDGNNLTGMVPSGLFNISTLIVIELSQNQLRGTIPSTLGLTLPKLEVLYLFINQFNGPLPVSLQNATSLIEVDFGENYFTGPVPMVGKLSRLQSFITYSNPNIEDDISSFISSLTNCANLRFLDVGNSLLSGLLPDTVANLSRRLQYIRIADTQVHGQIPWGIGNLVSLAALYLYDNNLEGLVPLGIGKLSNLQSLDLGGNRLTNELPSSFGNLSLLNDLQLGRNNFSGTIPKSLGNCTQLQILELSNNNFNGPIPREIMRLPSLSIYFSLAYNALTDSIPPEVGSLKNLGFIDLSNNILSGVIPNSLGTCASLERLHLEGNLFEGQIPSGLSSLKGLQVLDLSRNDLSGSIPSFLGELNLTNLNISFNRLQGEVPKRGVFTNTSAVSLKGNHELCGGIADFKLPSCNTSSISSREKVPSNLIKILIPSCSAVVVLFLCFIIFLYKRRTSKKSLSSLPSFVDARFLRLSYADLLKATGGFSQSNLIGVGRFGSVYKGVLDDGTTMVAIKVLNLDVRGASKSFMAECNALRGVRHRNLVKLLSVCESIDFQGNGFKALIYEFKANGSLEKRLYHSREDDDESGGDMLRKLGMTQRLNIAVDIAHGIEYLHYGTDSTIAHGDLKPSNILLDGEMTACVGDFGLAKIISEIVRLPESSSSIGIRGTLGYIPPEYGMSNSVSTQGDVYSFGMVLLEIFTKIRPTDDLLKDHGNLHSFVNAALPDHVMEIVDPLFQAELDLENGKIVECMASIVSIGVSCSNEIPRDRMSMTNVVNELHKIQKLLSSAKRV